MIMIVIMAGSYGVLALCISYIILFNLPDDLVQ